VHVAAARTLTRQKSYNRNGVVLPWAWDSVREDQKLQERYPYTRLMELPKFTAAIRIVRNGQPLTPVIANPDLSPWDKRRGRKKQKPVKGSELVGFPALKTQAVDIDMKPAKAKKADDFFG
jgi:hypothetical protein